MGMESLLGGGDSHESNVTGLAEALDPTSYFMPDYMTPHPYAQEYTPAINEALSAVTKPLNQIGTAITPGKAWLDEQVPILQQWNETLENRPVDAAAIVGSLYGGGAAAGAFSGGAAAGAGAAGTSFAPATTSAITPTFASGLGATTGAAAGSGLGTLGTAGTAYGSAALGGASAAQAGQAALAAGGGIGGLGAAGTAAANAAITPQLAGLSQAGLNAAADEGLGSYMGRLYNQGKELYDTYSPYYKKGKQLYDIMNPEQPEQQQEAGQPLVNPMTANPQNYMTARYLRGY